MPNLLSCPHFEKQRCISCQWLAKPYDMQLAEKSTALIELLKGAVGSDFLQQTEWLPAVPSPLAAFRNKAKMVVSGSVERVTLGILREQNNPESAMDLSDCPLYPKAFADLFPILKKFIARAGLVPYNIARKRGELKYILLTQSRFNQSVMIRFVLRSETKRPLIERELDTLLAQLPGKSVVSLNIQPQHSAVLEGEKEIFLTEQRVLEERFNTIPLFIRPQGFFQTNPTVASALYATAQQWVADLPINHLWDLFCGVGGFGLHCLSALQKKNPKATLTGIEISSSAIASAKQSAEQLGLNSVQFASLDSAQFACNQQGSKPDFVIVNPPRRGIGERLANYLNELAPPFLIYSSCNAQTMAKDFRSLTNYELHKIQLFDMFPHTSHYEVLTLLVHKYKG